MIEHGDIEYALVVDGEVSDQITEQHDRAAEPPGHDGRAVPRGVRLTDARLGRGGDGARPQRPAAGRPSLRGSVTPRRHPVLAPVPRHDGPDGHRHPDAARGRPGPGGEDVSRRPATRSAGPAPTSTSTCCTRSAGCTRARSRRCSASIRRRRSRSFRSTATSARRRCRSRCPSWTSWAGCAGTTGSALLGIGSGLNCSMAEIVW